MVVICSSLGPWEIISIRLLKLSTFYCYISCVYILQRAEYSATIAKSGPRFCIQIPEIITVPYKSSRFYREHYIELQSVIFKSIVKIRTVTGIIIFDFHIIKHRWFYWHYFIISLFHYFISSLVHYFPCRLMLVNHVEMLWRNASMVCTQKSSMTERECRYCLLIIFNYLQRTSQSHHHHHHHHIINIWLAQRSLLKHPLAYFRFCTFHSCHRTSWFLAAALIANSYSRVIFLVCSLKLYTFYRFFLRTLLFNLCMVFNTPYFHF